MNNNETLLVTGAAGFIGFHLSLRLLKEGVQVIGVDNLNPYYDVTLKETRLSMLKKYSNFTFIHAALEDNAVLQNIFNNHRPSNVVNLAAQAGVRYSLENPRTYIDSNLIGFFNVLEACRDFDIKHLVYASSSSVYGGNTKLPYSTNDRVDLPISLYAATKKANELMAHTYSHLYKIPSTGLRFFTVYGPWGRPDMAYFLFTKAILENRPIKVYNQGKMMRDFTYIDDIVEGVIRVINHPPQQELDKTAVNLAPYKIYNIGNNKPVELEYFIHVIEDCLGKKAVKEYLPLQAGDMLETFADVDDLISDIGFRPSTGVEDGISEFAKWFKAYYKY